MRANWLTILAAAAILAATPLWAQPGGPSPGPPPGGGAGPGVGRPGPGSGPGSRPSPGRSLRRAASRSTAITMRVSGPSEAPLVTLSSGGRRSGRGGRLTIDASAPDIGDGPVVVLSPPRGSRSYRSPGRSSPGYSSGFGRPRSSGFRPSPGSGLRVGWSSSGGLAVAAGWAAAPGSGPAYGPPSYGRPYGASAAAAPGVAPYARLVQPPGPAGLAEPLGVKTYAEMVERHRRFVERGRYMVLSTMPDLDLDRGGPRRVHAAGSRRHHAANWRYVNVRGGAEYGWLSPEVRRRLYYDRLESRDFPKALADLSQGVFGALLLWPEEPAMVSHSYALERLFTHLDMKLQARLAYASGASWNSRMAYGETLVNETLAKLVDGIMIEGDEYLVRFRLANGKRSPWVVMPVVFGPTPWAGSAGAQPRSGAYYYEGGYEVFEPPARISAAVRPLSWRE